MITRRGFVGLAAMAAGGCLAPKAGRGRLLFGACRSLKDAPLMKDAGFDFIEQGVRWLLVPGKSDAEYAAEEWLAAKNCPLPIRSCNGFLPATWPLVGPSDKIRWAEALKFADVAFRRADDLGIRYIVLGSSQARRAPEGISPERAREQFAEFAMRMADMMDKARRRVVVLLEPLRPAECNMFNTVEQGYELVDRIGSEHVRLLADIYHMCQSAEPPETFARSRGRILHCHIATRANRQAPGIEPDDLSAYLKELAKIGYQGGVSVEGGWGKGDLGQAMATAIETMRAWEEKMV